MTKYPVDGFPMIWHRHVVMWCGTCWKISTVGFIGMVWAVNAWDSIADFIKLCHDVYSASIRYLNQETAQKPGHSSIGTWYLVNAL